MTDQINYPWLLFTTMERLRDAIILCDSVAINNGVAYLYSLLKPYSSQEFDQLYSDIEFVLADRLSGMRSMSRMRKTHAEKAFVLESNMAKFQLMVAEIDRFGYLKTIKESSLS